MRASWTPTANMSNPNIANPLVRVFNTTNYVVNVVEGACTGSSFVTVVTDNSLTLQAGPDTSICSPAPVTLTANAVGKVTVLDNPKKRTPTTKTIPPAKTAKG